MRKFRDLETGMILSEYDLWLEFDQLKKENPEEYDYSFNQYLLNCSETFSEIREWTGNARILNSLLQLPKIGENNKYFGLVVSVELYDDKDDYVIYRVGYLTSDEYFDKNTDIAYWSYAIHKNNIK